MRELIDEYSSCTWAQIHELARATENVQWNDSPICPIGVMHADYTCAHWRTAPAGEIVGKLHGARWNTVPFTFRYRREKVKVTSGWCMDVYANPTNSIEVSWEEVSSSENNLLVVKFNLEALFVKHYVLSASASVSTKTDM